MFKEIIKNNQERIIGLEIIKRDFLFDDEILNLNKIITFVGPRRVGKTFTMFQVLKDLILKKYIKLEDVVFIDFSEFNNKEIDFLKILENFYELYPTGKPFFVFDEIQEIPNFKQGILKLFNLGYKIFVSGSNSNMLSSELATQFRGRIYEYFITTLSFKEFLIFNSFDFKDGFSTKERGIIKNYLQEYLTYGGYPEIVLIKNITIKENLIKNYLNIVIYKDLIERYKISNEFVIKYLIKAIILSNTKEINVNKLFNELKSQNIAVSKNTLYNYIEYLENIFFIKKIHNFYSPKGFYKVYLYDICYTFLYKNDTDLGKNFENIILFSYIKKGLSPLFKSFDKKEIDIYLKDESEEIQICYELRSDNLERELFFSKNDNLVKKLIILNNNTSNNIPKDIKLINGLDFLLGI